MMASNIQVLASNGLEVPRNTELDAQPGTFDLPAIVQTDPSSFPSLTTEDTLHLKGREVALYCTHSAETYTPDSGKPKLDGKHGLINKVARQLADSLQEQGLKAVYYDKIHDFPEYDKAIQILVKQSKVLSENRKIYWPYLISTVTTYPV